MSAAAKLRRNVARAKRAALAERLAYLRSLPIRSNTVVYESFAGNGVLCNPEAIFRRIVDDPEFADFEHVWVIADRSAQRRFEREFAKHPRVNWVPRGGLAYWKALSTAGLLINNATFPPEFGKRPGQIYLNTWHGTPLKQMGFDMPGGAAQSTNTLRNFLMADYLLAANTLMAETMYEDAYRLRNIYGGKIIEEGYPRIDRQRLNPAEREAIRAELAAEGIETGDRKIVLYAPTWRGASFQSPEADAEQLADRVAELQAGLGDDTFVLLRPHQAVHAVLQQTPRLAGIVAPSAMPTNQLLGYADGLITDFSSIFFDYLATGRPIAFYTPDAEDYQESRGTYLSGEPLPGPVSADARETGAQLSALLHGKERFPGYEDWAARFTPYEDGHATDRIVDAVFHGRTGGLRIRNASRDGRRRLLIYVGGMRSNGITSAALNLLKSIDYDRYDVTAVMPRFQPSATRANLAMIPDEVRQVLRVGGMNGSKLRQVQRRLLDRGGELPVPGELDWHERLWKDEWERMFGSATFDWAADFSGYDPFWANLILHSPGSTSAVWLHSEMVADRARVVHGKQPFKRKLGLVFSLYRGFDQLVSVSPSLSRLNREELAAYAEPEQFRTARNFPDPERVKTGAIAPLETLIPEDGPVPEWLAALRERTPEQRWFVTTARLAGAKNQASQIRAFARVHADHPETRLVIIGHGPLRQELEELIAELSLEGKAFLTGELSNPFAVMARSDCFVLSSRYEGQPMVLLEAAVCGLPIVSTAFATVEDALPPGAIHVVPQGDEHVEAGMRAFLRGEVPPVHFDDEAYIAQLVAEFDALADERVSARAE
ncbi:CDP-glycerol glycerophosphotransferase family protein [Leucobacter sp. CSA2]|uniref:CDP-glycerol glycerophosphotransferase family protein n=1 Tax=Leucobacter edaphi TaxID=2796472 RepID=A0A934UX24_9MICO|nr:glycosyltransferase [Leucobacter edaphi]MBK0420497.1 CDP-glycerol glycerophosphotransferase family protein [Leucobacter edaphi]